MKNKNRCPAILKSGALFFVAVIIFFVNPIAKANDTRYNMVGTKRNIGKTNGAD